MDASAPALLPLFRSSQQLKLLGALFASGGELQIGQLAKRAGIAQATASREVARLSEHGIVVTRRQGRNTLVSPNWDLPWARELDAILAKTVGVLGQLARSLSGVDGIEEAFVFGSWAARFAGEAGPPPNDIDVLVVGSIPLQAVRSACRDVERSTGVEVNPVVVETTRWLEPEPDPFIAQIRSRPIVEIPLDQS